MYIYILLANKWNTQQFLVCLKNSLDRQTFVLIEQTCLSSLRAAGYAADGNGFVHLYFSNGDTGSNFMLKPSSGLTKRSHQGHGSTTVYAGMGSVLFP